MGLTFLEKFKESCAFDEAAEQVAKAIGSKSEGEIRDCLPAFLKGVDSERRDERYYPTLMVFLTQMACQQLAVVNEIMYPEADHKGIPV